ncbi:MAG TPA: gamma-glutamyltransferase [Chthonomonadales bacterium]|nr:gamma-glutamyltransferase [Chthonomonadales bacterium]
MRPPMLEGQATRGIVVAKRGAVAASQPLAVSAAIAVLASGGNAVDAAIAASSVLTVTEPYASHLGGDAFVIHYDARTQRTTAYNGSGAAPAAATAEAFRDGIPPRGPRAASVPGLVDLWFTLHARHGSRPMAQLLAPAIGYARDGYAAGWRCARTFASHAADASADWFPEAARSLVGHPGPPSAGQIVQQRDLASTLERIAAGGREAFYDSDLTDAMVHAISRAGGLLARADFARHTTEVREPLRAPYRSYTVHGQPPVSQGIVLLQALRILDGYDLASDGPLEPRGVHRMVEALKLAFADRAAYLGDPAFRYVPVERLLSDRYAAIRRARIVDDSASVDPLAGLVEHDTTYFCVAGATGDAVSFIQSIFWAFGCGFVAEGTGVLFNNRMTGFSLDPASPNCLQPRKRTAHTLNACVVTQGDRLAYVAGTPGGDVQVQSNLQVISHLLDHGLDPQQAVEAPRWQVVGGTAPHIASRVQLESRAPEATFEGLAARGHAVDRLPPWGHGSSYQLIRVDPTSGAYHAASDPRCDGHAAGI